MEWIDQNGNLVATIFIAFGGLFIAGLAVQWLGQRTALPRVSLLICLGVIVGPTGFDLVSDIAKQTFPWISHLTLAMVGFLLGGKLHRKLLRAQGRIILSLSLWISLITWLVVTLVVGLLSQSWGLAILLGAIATATDPAATYDVIDETKQQSSFADALTGIVALDDIWGLIIFSLSLIGAGFLLDSSVHGAAHGLWELFGSLALGIGIGMPVAFLSGRLSDGEPLLIEALGAVLLCSGLAEIVGVSHLLACMTMGVVVTNLSRHHNRPFHAIQKIEWPFMLLFFVLAGASLELNGWATLGIVGTGYIGARVLGRLAGGWICSVRQRWPNRRGIDLGLALLPQAGVAIGIALAASQLFPQFAKTLLTTAIVATVIFELIGPYLARGALLRHQSDAQEVNS